MDIFGILVCVLAGLGAGVGTGFAGMSAAAVISPMLIILLDVPPYEAIGIALASDVLASAVSALTYAKNIGAHTVALTCNVDALIVEVAEVAIVTDTGAEVVTGSTRLKAGTAHKMVLNMITTGAMVMTGHVVENHMVNMKPTNIKLKERAARIIDDLTGIGMEKAREEVSTGLSIKEILKKYER